MSFQGFSLWRRISDGKLSCVRKQSNNREKGLVGIIRRTGDVVCESVSNVNNKQIKRMF